MAKELKSEPISIYAVTKKYGGGTFNRFGIRLNPTGGYAVGCLSHSIVVPNEKSEVENAFRTLAKEVEIIGTWIDPADGNVYVDHIYIVENLADALTAGRIYKQFCIYDFANGVTIKC